MATYKDGRRVFGPVEEFSTEETTTSQVLQPDGSGGLTWNPGSGGTGEANTSSNSGAGDGLALAKAGVDLPFKSLTAGSGITLTPSATEIEIASTGGGGAAGVIEFDVRNDTGAQLDIGTAVSSVAMYSATVYQAVKTDIGTEAHVLSYLGVMTADIANGASGKAYRIGPIENFDTSSWSAGDVLYVSGTAGLLTNVPPSDPVKELIAGKVLTSNATTGSMDAIARQEYNEHVDSTSTHGATGSVVGTTNTQTLTNKTLTTPTIGDFTNSVHDHADGSGGGTLAHTDLTAIGTNTHTEIDTHITSVEDLFQVGSGMPHGFPNRTDSDLSYVSGTRTITLAPAVTSFDYYRSGIKYTTSSTFNEVHTDATGNYFFYWDSSGTLQYSATPWDLLTDVPIAQTYYNATLGIGITTEERHASSRNLAAHFEFHFTTGTFWTSTDGLGLSSYTLQPGSPIDSDNQWAVASGIIHDEDIANVIAGRTAGAYKIFSRDGASGVWTWADNNVPLLSGGSYLYYNEDTGSTWQQTALATNKFVNYYIIAVGSIDADYDVIVVMGQEQHDSSDSAIAETVADLDFGTAVTEEMLFAYKITLGTSASYTTEGKARIEAVEDTRTTTSRQVIPGAGAESHNSLTGLQGGTAGEYYHFNSADYTDLTDAGDSTLHYHATDRARANHTGTQAASTISDFDTEVGNNTDVAANTAARHSQSHALDSTDHTGTLPESDVAFDNSTGHTHDGTDSTKVDYTDLVSIPSTFAPTAHKSAHEAGADGVDPALQVSASGSDGQVLTKGAGTAVGWEDAGGGAAAAVTVVSGATHTVVLANEVIHVTYTATAAVTVTIDSDNAVDGRSFYIVDAGGNAATYNITIATEGSETINSEVSGLMASDGEAWEIYSDGSNFFVR